MQGLYIEEDSESYALLYSVYYETINTFPQMGNYQCPNDGMLKKEFFNKSKQNKDLHIIVEHSNEEVIVCFSLDRRTMIDIASSSRMPSNITYKVLH